MSDPVCGTCRHPFYACHLESGRRLAADHEWRNGRCADCTQCRDLADAALKEHVREVVPA